MSNLVTYEQAKQLRGALKELVEATEELATIVHLITKKQGDAIHKAKTLLNE